MIQDRVTPAVRIDAGGPLLELELLQDDGALRIARLGRRGAAAELTAGRPVVEVVTVDAGHTPSIPRLVGGTASSGFRHVTDRHERRGPWTVTEVDLEDTGGLAATVRLEVPDTAAAVRVTTTLRNTGEGSRALRSIASAALRVGLGGGGATRPEDLTLHSAVGDWVGESRWTAQAVRDLLVDLHPEAHEHGDGRGCYAVTADGTWSTGRALPTGVLTGGDGALAWTVEHNGPWRWEIGEDRAGTYLAASGPTDVDHQWLDVLPRGGAFTTVPVILAAGADLTGAVAALTDARRALRRPHPDDARRPVVFNDYMNTLMGDPTTEKLLPLIDAASEAGAEIFCIDAGWYDDTGNWWYGVGDWNPSTVRFPDGGLTAVLDRIRQRDMVPGLWLEPEVIGVDSAAARTLPAGAFLQRAGVRIVEHGRYHLDLTHPAAIAHLDAVVDRLVDEYGVGFLKLDYNINPGPGTDRDGSAGVGLLAHNRAHLAWLDSVLDRHPDLVLENCASGAMRMDTAMLSRLRLQSTTDQQDPLAYPPIAAAAPFSMPPEQAGNWAYPQPDMSDERIAFTMGTAMLGRLYLSGRLDSMSGPQRMLVAEGVAAHKRLRPAIAAGHARWPLGLPGWTDPWTALAIGDGDSVLLTVWRREGGRTAAIALPELAGHEVDAEVVFPRRLAAWGTEWNAADGTLTVTAAGDEPAARTFRIGRHPATDTVVVHADRSTGAIRGGATGMLYGLAAPDVPAQSLVAGVRPRTMAQKAPGGLQHPGGDAAEVAAGYFAAGGSELLVYLQDALVEWPYEPIGVEAYASLAAGLARDLAHRDDAERIVLVPFNEGDWIWYDDASDGVARFLTDWSTLVRALRGVWPGVRIAGPNESRFRPDRLRPFLTAATADGTVPDVMTWHELQPSSLEHLPAHLAAYRALERELGIPPLPINIDEYANRRDTSVPGRMLPWIALLEEGEVDGDIAYWTMAGNLDDHAVGHRRANGGWWLLHWYAALGGDRIAVDVPSPMVRDSVAALAARDGRRTTVLVGGGLHPVDVALDGLGADGDRRVRVERVRWSGYEGAVEAPELLSDDEGRVLDGRLALRLPRGDPFAAVRITVLPPGDGGRDEPDVALVVAAADGVATDVDWIRHDDDAQQYAGSGARSVRTMPQTSSRLEVALEVPHDGRWELALGYGTDGAAAETTVTIDDGAPIRLPLPATLSRGFGGRAALPVSLGAGRRTIRIAPPADDPARGDIAVDRVELRGVRNRRRTPAATALRSGGSIDEHGEVSLTAGGAVRFFVGAREGGVYRLDAIATGTVEVEVEGVLADTAAVPLAAGISEVRVVAISAATIAALEIERVADGAPMLALDRPGGASAQDSVAELVLPAAPAVLLTLRYSNADRRTGHEYNADVVDRRLSARIDDGEPFELVFPFTHHWDNAADRSSVLAIPPGGRVLRVIASGPAPRLFAAAIDPIGAP